MITYRPTRMVPTAGADSADRNQASNAQLRIDSLAYNKTAVRATFVAVAGSAAASFIVYLTGVSGFWLVLVTPFIVFITSELVRTQTDKLVTDAQQAVACARDPVYRNCRHFEATLTNEASLLATSSERQPLRGRYRKRRVAQSRHFENMASSQYRLVDTCIRLD